MSLCSLLHLPPSPDPKGPGFGIKRPFQDETFAFEHSMSHRRLLGSMAPLPRFSTIPYVLNPGTNLGDWHQDHQQAHNDFTVTLPGWFGFPVTTFIHPGYDLQDTDLRNRNVRTWWTFQNEYTHRIAENIQNSELWIFPFW